MFINVKTSIYNEFSTTAVNVDNIDYIEDVNSSIGYEYNSRIVFKDGNKLTTTMHKYEIIRLINKE